MKKSLTIKINQCGEQVCGPVRKLYGLLPPKSLAQLLDTVELAANPRSAKKGSVTADIEDSLRENPELFPAKTKGILLASASYRALERDRYQLMFEDLDTEGLIDGGHNAMAAGRHCLQEAGLSDRELSRVKDWAAFRDAWTKNRDAIEEIVDVLNFEMPVEVQVPADMNDELIVETFKSSLLEIGAARNNNVQLTEETKANKKGFYDLFKAFLPSTLAEQIEWKTNDGGRIRVRDVIALSWVPLSLLELPDSIRVHPNQIYRNKAICVSAFNKLVAHPEVSEPAGGYAHTLHNEAIKSAMKITGDLPDLYDALTEQIPRAYNNTGGKFGKINAVRIFDPTKTGEKNVKYLRSQPRTAYFRRPIKNTCPDGFIVPLLYGLRALMTKDSANIITWKTDPHRFLQDNLDDIMKSYRLVIEMANWDPQKVGKNIGAYEFADKTIAAILNTTKADA